MQITRISTGSPLELQIEGRLDSYWANHLDGSLSEALREGHDQVRLDLSAVAFLSSAGIRVLIRYHKKLAGIQGSLSVTRPSEPVRSVLEIAGLARMLIEEAGAVTNDLAAEAPPAPATARPRSAEPFAFENASLRLQVYEQHPGARARCQTLGNPALLRRSAFTAADCNTLRCEDDLLALGLGAFGGDFEDCRERFGELLVATGAVAYLPTDGSSVPDYLLGAGALPPEANVLYGLVCRGAFARMARFEAPAGDGVVQLTALARAALELSEAPLAALAVVGEVSGLVGAALRRSPAQGGASEDIFAFPGIRTRISFTAERAFARSQALVVGIVADAKSLDSLPTAILEQLRPISGEAEAPLGQFHAAVFPFRPIRKGMLDLRETVATLFSTEALLGLLNLLNDERPVLGAGQSEFVRGACWMTPLDPATTTEA